MGRESRAGCAGGGGGLWSTGHQAAGGELWELSAHHGDGGMSVGGLRWPFLWASLHLSLTGVGDRHVWRRVSRPLARAGILFSALPQCLAEALA